VSRADNREVWGLRCELVGLLAVLLATFWQAAFTDWFEKNSNNWVAYIQEEVNFAVLYSLSDLSRQLNTTDKIEKEKIALEIRDKTSGAVTKAIKERGSRETLDKGQSKIFSLIRYSLLAAGALLIIFGKWLVLAHKSSDSSLKRTRRKRRAA
jgi:hypothetical protein